METMEAALKPTHSWTAAKIVELRMSRSETQVQFARHFRLGVGAVRTWEQGIGTPSGTARVVLDFLKAGFTPPPEH